MEHRLENRKISDWFSFFAPRLVLTAIVAGVLTRILLLLNPVTKVDFTALEWLKIFILGMVNDVAFAMIALVPAFLIYCCLNKWKYSKAGGWTIWGILLAAMLYFLLCDDISDQYGGVVPTIVNILSVFLFICFSIKWFIPSTRIPWRRFAIWATTFVYSLLIAMNIFSEWTFWSEFGVRYNFIAVDYLVYTNEVIGNIMESYNMPLLIALAVLAGAAVCYLMTRGGDIRDAGIGSTGRFLSNLAIVAAGAIAGGFFLHWGYRNLSTSNVFATELQENGCWNFLEAFSSNELEYEKFYPMLPGDEASSLQKQLCGQDSLGIRHEGDSTLQAKRKNIVLVTIESMSGGFMERYAGKEGITPNLDSLARGSMTFDSLFATGNRTVRGLEAVSLCIPPSSGESIVKRPDCGGRFATSKILHDYGYTVRFHYGGDSYFDNMGAFFSGNGYDVFDRKDMDQGKIVFENIWGVSDEDSYREALSALDRDYASGKPFFTHIMTISNHRPYTYPEGRIEYDGNPMSRSAAVKYTDWALGEFLREASLKPWFSETVFVILADHCASSAGKTSLPLDGYHIPAMIYSPGFVEPMAVKKVCSQIDIMPTLFSILGFSYDSRFYGQDILSPSFRQRAFVATYQDLGYYSDGILTVLSPVRKVRQYKVRSDEGYRFTEEELSQEVQPQLREAMALYQMANLEAGKGSAGSMAR